MLRLSCGVFSCSTIIRSHEKLAVSTRELVISTVYASQRPLDFHQFKAYKHSRTPLSIRKDSEKTSEYLLLKRIPHLMTLRNEMDITALLPPSSVQGMTELDRDAFAKKVTVPFVRVTNENVHCAVKGLKKYMLKMEKLKPVQTDSEDPTKRILLLNPLLVKSVDDIKEEIDQILSSGEAEFLSREITLTYENWKSEDIIKSVLPDNLEGAQGYSLIGSIVHLNLRENVLPYKKVIGEVLLEKLPNVNLVVNKTNIIDTTYRNFEMEVLAGTGKTHVTVKENGFSFSFDFAKVYWNPRLSTEHERIVKKVKQGDLLFDVMAGVGPFAIPAGRKHCKVLANDLNPHSYESLVSNCTKNKVKERVKCYNLDGHEFIRTVLRENLLKAWHDSCFIGCIHITMNLPAMAVEFLPSFVGLLSTDDDVPENVVLPLVHVYMFTGDGKEETAISMVAEKLEYVNANMSITSVNDSEKTSEESTNLDTKNKDIIENGDFGGFRQHVHEVTFVRQVAPNKAMMRVSFKLSLEILKLDANKPKEPPTKKLKEG